MSATSSRIVNEVETPPAQEGFSRIIVYDDHEQNEVWKWEPVAYSNIQFSMVDKTLEVRTVRASRDSSRAAVKEHTTLQPKWLVSLVTNVTSERRITRAEKRLSTIRTSCSEWLDDPILLRPEVVFSRQRLVGKPGVSLKAS